MPRPPRGPGDDAALLDRWLITSDALLEGEHFLADEPPFLTGRKALNVNLSDIAAMGGNPVAFLLNLGLPGSAPPRWTGKLLDGFASAAREHGVEWVGGDIVRSRGKVVLSVTALGRRGRRILKRSGARPGDGIWVTGPLGAAHAGRDLLGGGWRVRAARLPAGGRWRSRLAPAAGSRLRPALAPPRGDRRPRGRKGGPRLTAQAAAELVAAQLDPVPRLEAGRLLATRHLASAGMDLSDGLSLDLARLCEASGVGALVYREALPISQPVRDWAAATGREPWGAALDGGEDYEILFTAPDRSMPALLRWPLEDGTGPVLVGRVTPRRRGLRLAGPDGRTASLRPGGYDPFARRR